jgi:hypothetical protein
MPLMRNNIKLYDYGRSMNDAWRSLGHFVLE